MASAHMGSGRKGSPDYRYGYFSVFAFFFPPTRWRATALFRQAFLSAAGSRDWKRIDIVAHSFGTYLAARALLSIPQVQRPRVHTIVLAGSVLPPRFPWKHLFVRGLLTRVINDCGTRDGSLVLSKLFILGTGHAGRAGFQGMTGSHLVNRFFQFGHSGYFLLKTQPSDTFMQLRWVDVLLTEAAVQPIDERPPLTFTRGVFEVLVNNAELAKVAAYIVFLTCGLLFVNHVVVAAKQDLARKRAATAMQDMERDLVAALPLALKALDTAPIVESKGALIFALANGDKIDAFLERSAEPMYCVAFSLNGSLLAYTSDRSVKLWRHTPSWEGPR